MDAPGIYQYTLNIIVNKVIGNPPPTSIATSCHFQKRIWLPTHFQSTWNFIEIAEI